MNQGIYGLTRADGGNPSRPFATTADAQAGLDSRLISTPQNVRDAVLNWWFFPAQNAAITNSASLAAAAGNPATYFILATTTTTNGTVVLYNATPGSGYYMQGVYSGQSVSAKNWAVPQSMWIRLARHTSAANSILRVQWGEKTTPTTFAQMSGRGIGAEIRDARLWIIAHNGSALTQFDTGINVNGGEGNSAVPFDLLLTSNNGTVTVAYSNAGITLTASTPGGPVNMGTNISFPSVELTNGTSATACTYFVVQPRITIQ